jgi:predicted AlkP superfamily phosphohydrolase/phosphomutase
MSSSRARTALLVAVLALLTAAPAAAYIDPGTAGLVVGGAGGALVWLLGAVAIIRLKFFGLLKWGFNSFKKHPVGGGIAILVLLGAGASARSLLEEEEKKPVAAPAAVVSGEKFDRVLMLGIDGTDPDMMRALMKDGLLPNFQALVDAGGLHDLDVPNPAESPVVWASLATGQNPGQHGIFDFIGRDPERYLPNLALLHRDGDDYRYPIQATAFWDVTTQHQVPATIVRWPVTFPPSKVHGRVYPGLGVPDIRGGLGAYSFFTDAARDDAEEGARKVTTVAVEDGLVKTELMGPRARGLTGTKQITLPLEVKVDAANKSVLIDLDGQKLVLSEGGWTEFVEVTFTSGVMSKHRGIVQFHLVSTAEPFALYATPVQLHPDEPVVTFTHPADYAKELRQAIGLYHTLGMPEDTKALGEGRISDEAFLKMCDDVEQQRRKMLLYEMSRFEEGVLAFVFDTPDRIQHMTPAPEGDLATSPVGRYYLDFDRFLGKVMDKLPANTPVMIFSDHGFSTFDHAVDLNRWLVDNGYMVIDEARYKARDAGKNGELYEFVDWSKTKAYAVGFAGIFLNVEGREGEGIVPAAEVDGLAQEIANKLAALKDPKSGEPVVHKTYRRGELYAGDHEEKAPDLVVGLHEGYRGGWQSAVGGLTDDVISDNHKKWQRDHIVDAEFVDGTLITNFPLGKAHPHAVDIAPTVLSMLGLPVPAEMEGKPLHLGTRVASRGEPEGNERTP